MTNAEASALLSEMAVLLELAGANPFKVRAYQRASFAVAALPKPVCEMPEKEVLEVPGIGSNIAAHLKEVAGCGTWGELRALRRRFPVGLQEMLRLPGLGPKKARHLFEAGIADLKALEDAARAGRLREMPGFGPKAEENVLKGLPFAREKPRLLCLEAAQIAEELAVRLRQLPGVLRAEVAGSTRRGRETVGDIDILCASKSASEAIAAFVKLPQVRSVIAQGGTKASVNLLAGPQCDLRVVPPQSFGAALVYFTGSKAHNIALRALALKKGLTVNEYGVFRLSDKNQKRPVAGRTEEDVYAALGLAWTPPELREDRGEIDAARQGKLPRLVELEDVRGDFHNHSTYTDGRQSLEAMARAAKERGWEWVALADHSQSLYMTKGLKAARLRKTIAEVRRLERKIGGIALMRSMEVDILEDGRMDYPDDVLDEIDVVIGSVHSRFKQSEAEMTARLVKAASNRRVDIVGHLSGRLINRRPAYAFDAEMVMAAAAKSGTAFEINGQPDRQDIDDVRAQRARELGCPIALDTDAHSTREFRYMEMAVKIARRAWLTPRDVLNCLSAREVRAWLDARSDGG